MRLKLWIRAMRAPFFQAVIIPAVLGTAVAWYETGTFLGGYFVLVLLGVVFLNAGTNLANDYFDHRSGADAANKAPTPFSGGSRVIQEGLIAPGRICAASLLFFVLAVLVGLGLIYLRGWPILAFGSVGLLSGYFYTSPPIRLGYRGFGELLAGVNAGPLVVCGAYYVQAGTISPGALVASMPVGLLIAAVLYINELPDHDADKAAGKKTIIVIMGKEKAARGFYLLMPSAYVVIALAIAVGIVPWQGLLIMLTVPVAWKTLKIASANYPNTSNLTPAMARTIFIHFAFGALLSAGYVAAGILT